MGANLGACSAGAQFNSTLNNFGNENMYNANVGDMFNGQGFAEGLAHVHNEHN
jgi:hypothetical protein